MPKNRNNRKRQRKHTNWAGRTPTQDKLRDDQIARTHATQAAERARRLAERVAEFLRPVGASIEPKDGQVLINGEPVGPGGSGALDVVDEVGVRQYGQRLLDAADSQLVQRIPDLTVQMRLRLLEIRRDGKRIGLIKPTHASIEADHGEKVDGNFLLPEHHCWEELRAVLGAATPTTILTQLPASANEQESDRAISASSRIRENRARDYAARARIHREIDDVTIAFQRISTSRPIEVPFELIAQDGSSLRAALRLAAPGEVLPLAITTPVPDSATVVKVWLIALETFAHLTCVDPNAAPNGREASPRSRTSARRTGIPSGRTSAPQARHLRPVPTPGSGFAADIPTDLVPTLVTAHALSHHHVVGHARQLPPGQTPDPEKVRVAAALGIKLGPGITWVASHWRGTGDDPELEFNWQADTSASDLNETAA
jgi:hypothetical protein